MAKIPLYGALEGMHHGKKYVHYILAVSSGMILVGHIFWHSLCKVMGHITTTVMYPYE